MEQEDIFYFSIFNNLLFKFKILFQRVTEKFKITERLFLTRIKNIFCD